MPYKRDDSPIWYASYTDARGRRARRSTETTDRREAEAIEARWKLEAHRERTWGERPPLTFEEASVLYLRTHTGTRELEAVRSLREFFAGMVLNSLSPETVTAYKSQRAEAGRSPATINRELATMSAIINHANKEHGHQLPNPVRGRLNKGITNRVRWITRDEAERLLIECRRSRTEYLADFMTIALHTGARKQELLGLEWTRVDFAHGLLHLEAEHTKAGKRRSIPMSQTVREVLERRQATGGRYVFGGTDRVGNIRKAFGTACDRAGISDFTIHDLRHTCAAWLVSAGVPLSAVRDLLGHASVTMTEKYAHLSPDSVRVAVSVLDCPKSVTHANARLGKIDVSA